MSKALWLALSPALAALLACLPEQRLTAAHVGVDPADARDSDAATAGDGFADDDAAAGGRDGSESEGDDSAPPCAAGARFDELLSRLESEIRARQIPGAAVAIACANGEVHAGGAGALMRGTELLIDGDTRFQIASMTKSLTAATAILLEDEGVLERTAPLDDVLLGINTSSPYTAPVTLEQLLAHTAGYPVEIPNGVYSSSGLAAFFADNADAALWSPPGRVWNYANYGYALAGLAMERAAETPFAQLVETRLFAALGMSGATLDAARVVDEGQFAYGHTGSTSEVSVLGPLDSYYAAGWYAPMGGAWVSARDLARFAGLLLDDDPAAPFARVREEMSKPRARTDYGPAVSYGQGLFLDDGGGDPIWFHGGSVEGYLTDVSVFPAHGVALVILVNADWAFPVETLWWAHGDLIGWAPGAPPAPPTALDGVVGSYRDDVVLGRIDVVTDGSGYKAVFVDDGSEAALEIAAEDTATFFYFPWDMELPMTFWRNDDGAVEFLATPAGVARSTSASL